MKTENAIPKFSKPERGLRGWTSGTTQFGHVARHLTAHHTAGPQDPFLYWHTIYGVKVMNSNRLLRRLLFHTWKDTLSQTNRDNWEAAALTVSIANYKDLLKVPSGYELFTWHHFFNSNLETPSGFPFNWSSITFDLDPPDPYVLPDKPNITGLIDTNPDGFTVSLDNWPTDGDIVCLTSTQRIALIQGKAEKSRRFTGRGASGTGTAGSGYLTAYPLYPWQDPATGTTFRIGLRYRTPPAPAETDPTSPTTAADAGGPNEPWTDPENICDYNASVATALLGVGSGKNFTNQITATNFEWTPAIPPAATITRIKVEIMGQSADAGNGTQPDKCQLLKAGVPAGEIVYPQPWNGGQTFPWAYQTMVPSTYTWGETWTGADVNDPNFGFQFSAKVTGYLDTDTAQIAHVKMTIYYTAGGRIPSNPTFYDWTRPAP